MWGIERKKVKDKKDANEAQDPRKELLQTAGFHMNQIINGGSIIIIRKKKEEKKRCKNCVRRLYGTIAGVGSPIH